MKSIKLTNLNPETAATDEHDQSTLESVLDPVIGGGETDGADFLVGQRNFGLTSQTRKIR